MANVKRPHEVETDADFEWGEQWCAWALELENRAAHACRIVGRYHGGDGTLTSRDVVEALARPQATRPACRCANVFRLSRV